MHFALLVSLLTFHSAQAAKINLPPCPEHTERAFHPSSQQPNWAGCLDSKGLYQGFLVQFSNQTQIIRIAHVKNSFRHGREIRAGASGTFEERQYLDGHLTGLSWLFRAPDQLFQLLPNPMTAEVWAKFKQPSDESLLKAWIKAEPFSTLTFENGRIIRLQAAKVDHRFKIAPDGRIMALNHPEMKDLFFVDPEALWVLTAADLRAALLPGFGSCKKYSGPIGRFGRHFDHLLYKREASEATHVQKLKAMRDRFVNFCVPEDIRQNLGTMECPPQMPSVRPPTLCYLPLSDQAKIPYQPKFFKFAFTLKKPPHEFQKIMLDRGLNKFVSDYETFSETIDITGSGKLEDRVMLKKTPRGVRWRPHKAGAQSDQAKDWWEWQGIPGY